MKSLAKPALVPVAAAVVSLVPRGGTAYAAGCNGTGCENDPDRTTLISRRTVDAKDGQHDWTNMVGGKGYMVRACGKEKTSGKLSCTPFAGTDA
ncbi:hypothetical protein [Streptomyces sp. R41]|uniref:Secreted protein n=1 Tax=Streptomyces sp. R41 TaxID=3238632 RepID=A0AB39RPP1_9ACTN